MEQDQDEDDFPPDFEDTIISKSQQDIPRHRSIFGGITTKGAFMELPAALQVSWIRTQALRGWWHGLLRNFGRYPCCAFFLVLPSNKDAILYLYEHGKELDLISRENCLVIALGKTIVRCSDLGEEIWKPLIREHIIEGHSIEVARLFDIAFTEFPCLVVFQDIRSPSHIVMTLRDMTSQEIADKMRSVFSIIQRAVLEKREPLSALESHQLDERLRQKGQSIITKIRNLTGKTFETAMEAWLKTIFK